MRAAGRLLRPAAKGRASSIWPLHRPKPPHPSIFKAPTHAVHDMIKSGSLLVNVVGSEATINILPGGFPIALGGVVVGALGIAGGHYSQDQALGEEVLAKAAPKG